jgi:penicillin G amidase
VRLFDEVRMPHQNAVLGDRDGNIAWILTGETRQQDLRCNRKQPYKFASADQDSCEHLKEQNAKLPNAYINPRIEQPANDRLWTANARVLDGEALQIVGDAGYANGARAKQIRDGLLAKNQFTEKDLLDIQLDHNAIYLKRWWEVMRKQTGKTHAFGDSQWKDVEQATRKWEGKASTDSVSYRITRAWRLAVIERMQDGLLSHVKAELGDQFMRPDLPQFEGIAWQLVNQEPLHLLPRPYKGWDELYSDAMIEVVDSLKKKGPLNQRTWGEKNTARICHPLAGALPAFTQRWLCMPKDQLNGDGNMPMVSAPDFGASQRMVVSPGREEDGIIQMPGGQSGHLLSPFWGAGHRAWVTGEPTEFLPGEMKYKINAKPSTTP